MSVAESVFLAFVALRPSEARSPSPVPESRVMLPATVCASW